MRYRVDEDPSLSAYGATDDVMLLTCVLGIVIGLGLTWAGWYGRQWWLVFWCSGLVVVSVLTIVWEVSA